MYVWRRRANTHKIRDKQMLHIFATKMCFIFTDMILCISLWYLLFFVFLREKRGLKLESLIQL